MGDEWEVISEKSPQKPQYNPILQGITNFIQSGAESAGNLLGSVYEPQFKAPFSGLLPQQGATQKAIRSVSEKVLPEEYLDQDNKSFARRAGAAIPGTALSLASGTGLLTAAASLLGGTTGEKGAEALGFKGLGEEGGTLAGSVVQLGASLLGSGLANKSLNFVSKLVGMGGTDIAGTAQKVASEFYEREKQLGEKIWGYGNKYKVGLETFKEDVKKRGIPSEMRKELVQAAHAAEKNITGAGLVNGSDLAQIHEDTNKLFRLVKDNDAARKMFDRLQGLTIDTAKGIGKHHPEWLKSWLDGDEIYSALKYSQNLNTFNTDKILKSVKNPIVEKVLQGLGIGAGYAGIKNPLAAGAIGATAAAASSVARDVQTIKKFLEKPSTQRILQDVFKGVVNREIPQFTKAIQRLDRLGDSFEHTNKTSDDTPEGWEVITQ